MVRATMILLCFLLLAAAAGRYKAEVSVREAKRELKALEDAKAQELSMIKVLRAEVAYLESPERLAKIAARHTDLGPLTGTQLMTADEFVLALAGAPAQDLAREAPAGDVIMQALAMAEGSGLD
ncbi:MAG: hypothetical protein HXY23_09195 [Parvularculaceae bacterium]|nr:hypothetical protein [Parvularculaceae bacterium]